MSSTGGSSPLPKFGDWNVNDPASAESYTMIFGKARDERKQNSIGGTDSTGEETTTGRTQDPANKQTTKKWCCCFQASPTNT